MLEGRKTMGFLSIFPSNPMLADLLESGVPGNGSIGYQLARHRMHTILSLTDLF